MFGLYSLWHEMRPGDLVELLCSSEHHFSRDGLRCKVDRQRAPGVAEGERRLFSRDLLENWVGYDPMRQKSRKPPSDISKLYQRASEGWCHIWSA